MNPGQKEDSLAQPFFFLHQAEQQDSTSFAITKETKSSENATGTTNQLKVLVQRGPLKLTQIMYKANVNCGVLKEHIDFLIKQGLFEERIIRRERVVYAITHRGVIVLKQFKELKEVLPIVEETKNQTPYMF